MAGGKVIVGILGALIVAGAAWWGLEQAISRQKGDSIAATADAQTGEEKGDASEEPQDSLPAGMTSDEYDRAAAMFRSFYPGSSPDRFDILSLSGELAANEEDYAKAVACLREIPTNHSRYGLPARLQEGTALVKLHRVTEAERVLREYLSEARKKESIRIQDVIDAYKWLNYVLSAELRLEERAAFLVEVHQIGLADILDSKQLFFPNLLILNSPAGRKKIEDCLQVEPENLDLQIANVRYLTLGGSFEEAVSEGEKLMARHPDDLRVAGVLMEALFESDQLERFDEVAGALPSAQESDPWLIMRLRGEYALGQGNYEDAVRQFQWVLQRDPANAPAQMGLATAYGKLGKTDEQKNALERSGVLAQIRVNLNNIQNDAIGATKDLVEKCNEIDFPLAAKVFQSHVETMTRAQGDSNPEAKPVFDAGAVP